MLPPRRRTAHPPPPQSGAVEAFRGARLSGLFSSTVPIAVDQRGMSSLAKLRLQEERKGWKSDHPVGFWAKPIKAADGSIDLLQWEAGIPGRAGVRRRRAPRAPRARAPERALRHTLNLCSPRADGMGGRHVQTPHDVY